MKNLLKLFSRSGIEGSYVIKTWDAEKVKCFEDTKHNTPLSVSKVQKNLVVAGTGTGKNILVRQLANDTTYPISITLGAIGTGSTAPAASDTGLETQVLGSIPIADSTVGTSSLAITFFITDAQLANGTYREFGVFCAARLFARSLISPVFVKSSNQNVTIEYSITFT